MGIMPKAKKKKKVEPKKLFNEGEYVFLRYNHQYLYEIGIIGRVKESIKHPTYYLYDIEYRWKGKNKVVVFGGLALDKLTSELLEKTQKHYEEQLKILKKIKKKLEKK